MTPKSGSAATALDVPKVDHFRFHRPHAHLATTFGSDGFALKAEAFARFFGTPLFLGAQTVICRHLDCGERSRFHEVRRLPIHSP